MEMLAVNLHMATSDGGLKELVLRWFTETQVPLILNNGKFPDWFQGFAGRKDTEDLLRDKALGCFLIRLSDKAIGYILSYKGHDRCRHFVITQDPGGQFVISGDGQTYRTLTELIEHYKVSPIQPFGEYLTSSCYEVNTGELYDMVHYKTKGKSGVSVQALRTLWDCEHHNDAGACQMIQQQNDVPAVQPPALPPKSKSRKLTGAACMLQQGAPPVPKRGLPLGFSLSDTASHLTLNTSERVRGTSNPELMSDTNLFNTTDMSYPGDPCPPGFSELMQVDSRRQSLPGLNKSSMGEGEDEEEDEYSNQLSSSFSTSYFSAPLRKVTCHTYSLQRVEISRPNPLYQILPGPGGDPAPQGDAMNTKVPQTPTPAGLPNNTYEQIPGEAVVVQGNTYESLEDVKTKKSKYTWGKKNVKWKNFFPEYRKK